MENSETNEGSYANEPKETQQKEINIYAKRSLFSVLLGVLLIAIIVLDMVVGISGIGSGLGYVLLVPAILSCFAVSTVLSICGIISILRNRKKVIGIKRAIFSLLVSLVFWLFIIYTSFSVKNVMDIALCKERLYEFRSVIYGLLFEKDRFPLTGKWCDSLLEDVGDWAFLCPKAKDAKCSYALNKNVIGLERSQLPEDIVLLFETDDGLWNQVGGKELLSTKNHKGGGCNILFADMRVEFVSKEDFHTLRWEP